MILYFALPWGGNLFGFIRPRAALFADDKLYRYPQPFLYGLLVFFLSAIPLMIVLVIVDNFPTQSGNSVVQEYFNLWNKLFNGEQLGEQEVPGIVVGSIIIGVVWLFFAAMISDFFESIIPVHILPRLDRARTGKGGASGRFSGYLEEKKSAYKQKNAGIYLGRSLFSPFLKVGLEDDRHMLTIAGTRSGKGTSVIIPNLLQWPENAVVIDPKGTSAIVTHRRREELGNDVIVVDPFGITGLESAVFNPMSFLDMKSPTVSDDIRLIADALVLKDKSAKDPHWDQGARTVLAGLIAQIATHPGITDKSLPMLRSLITLPLEEKAKMWNDMLNNPAAGRLPVTAANRVLGGKDNAEIQSILSNADKHTEWLESPTMREALTGKNTVDFAKMRQRKTTIFFVIPLDRMETENRFIRLFINTLIKQYVRGGKAERKTLLIMDEFLSLDHMKEVENAMSWAAGFNLILWPFVQDWGTFEDLYGAKTNAFLTNSRAVQVFGVDDPATNKFVSEKLGRRGLTGLMSIRRSNETTELRAASEVGLDIEASSKRQYVMRTGKPTMLLERTDYYNSRQFEYMFNRDPDFPEAKILKWYEKKF